jgi:aminoglycoside phosphotransferase (APT) family kinase protein
VAESVVAGAVDMTAVERWMDSAGLGDGPLAGVELMAGGTQNVLVRFSRGGCGFVLRRPPLHKRKNSDETMRREARVLAGLAGTGVPHPRLIAECDDLDVIGAVFYLMEPVAGFTPTVAHPAFLDDPASQREMALAVVDALAAIGRVDVAGSGLATLGRAEGWLERQVDVAAGVVRTVARLVTRWAAGHRGAVRLAVGQPAAGLVSGAHPRRLPPRQRHDQAGRAAGGGHRRLGAGDGR